MTPDRSGFERDWDRILFSTAFRRMHDKTQVFPLPDDDVVHSRLTHSLEVASVGRTLGRKVGLEVVKRRELEPDFTSHHFGEVVAAACLAHDIGNPPFGHAGEDAIASFFQSAAGSEAISGLTDREQDDFRAFEGNAQGYRIISRLQLESDGGLQLTAATLAAFSKYPRESGSDGKVEGRASTKKYGFFQQDRDIFGAVAKETGLAPALSPKGGRGWRRHPLAFLVEAADDICYSILDIEDGVRLGLVDASRAQELLQTIAARAELFSKDRLGQFSEPKEKIGYLRAMAIGQMIEECATVFLANEPQILDGSFDKSLADVISGSADLKDLRKLARERCYQAPEVIEIELAGYEALGGLLEQFVPAVRSAPSARKGMPGRAQKTLHLLRERGVNVDEDRLYDRLLRVTDYVSGMTDRHALATYRRLKGITIPGRAG